MKRLILLLATVLVSLGGISRAQTFARECSGAGLFAPFYGQLAVDNNNVYHEVECWNPATGKITFPLFTSSSVDLTNVTTDIIPSLDNTFKIGSASKTWTNIFAQAFTVGTGTGGTVTSAIDNVTNQYQVNGGQIDIPNLLNGGNVVQLVLPQTLTQKILTAPQIQIINDLVQNLAVLQTFAQAASVNDLLVSAAATGAAPGFTAQGTDANIGIAFTSKGTQPVFLNTINGTATNPSVSGSTVNTGWYYPATNQQCWTSLGTAKGCFLAGALNLVAGTNFGITAGADPTTGADTAWARRAAAIWQSGGANSSAPVNQSLTATGARGGTDTNTAGANYAFFSGVGTGNSTPSTMTVEGDVLGTATGTGLHNTVHRFAFAGTRKLTTLVATTIASIPLASTTTTGGHVDYHLEATDGTAQCTLDGDLSFSAENSAGVFVTNVSTLAATSTACTATKTLSATWALTGANPALLQITPTLTGITPTSFNIIYSISNFGQTNVTWTQDGQ